MINCLLVGKYEDTVRRVGKICSAESSKIIIKDSALTEQEALEKIENVSPDVVIIELSGASDRDLLQIAKRIYLYKPHICTLVYVDSVTDELYKEAISYGVKYIGIYPISQKDFENQVEDIHNTEAVRNEYLTNTKSAIIYSSTVIGFYGTKSGIGTTTLAVNTAIGLAQNGKSVALLDMDLEFGDIASYFDISPKKSIADIIQEFPQPNINNLESYMDVHSSGVRIMSAPKSPEYAEIVTPEKIHGIIDILKSYYDYIIIDMPDGFTDTHHELFKNCNKIYFNVTPEIPILRNAKLAIALLNVLQEKHKINIIVNRTGKGNVIGLKEIHGVTNCRIVAQIPSDYRTASSAINAGKPFMSNNPKALLSKSVMNIVKYTLSKNDDLDVWDMPASRVEKVYDELYARDKTLKNDNKKGKSGWGFFQR